MHATLLFFTAKGKCYWLKVFEIPEGAKNAKGRAIQNLLNIEPDDKVQAFIRVKKLTTDTEFINSHYLLFCTKKGVIKKTLLEAYSRPRQNGVNAITLREDDGLIQVCMTNGNNEVIIANRNGRAIRFHESAVRVMGRTASGVKGMTLDEDNTDDLLAISAIPALAIVYMLLRILTQEKITIDPGWLNNPLMWLAILLLTTTIVFVTVAYRIWLISRLNPAEVIKTE